MAGTQPTEGARGQFGPNDWIAGARKLLVEKSIDAVRVEAIAKEMRVTKGSFYWHFKGRDDLLKRMLMAWRDEATEQIIFRFESQGLPARDLLKDLLDLPFHGAAAQQAAATELAIRAWARRDEMARAVVNEVDAKRLSYVAQCFSAIGFGIAEARARAFAFYGYELSEALLSDQGTQAQKAERRAFIERLLLGAPDFSPKAADGAGKA